MFSKNELFKKCRFAIATGAVAIGLLCSTDVTAQPSLPQENSVDAPAETIQLKQQPFSVRIKDITDIEGVRAERIGGLGLVVGLAGTGGNTPTTREFVLNMLENKGFRATPDVREAIRTDQQFKTDNVTVVYVTAELPPFSYKGQTLDVNVNIFDDATSLQDGRLVSTVLRGADDKIYAVASGQISLGGFGAGGQGASVKKNALTSGRVPGGAMVEDIPICEKKIGADGFVRLNLKNRDMRTAQRISDAINSRFRNAAKIENSRAVSVQIPTARDQDKISRFIAQIQDLRVTPDNSAKIIINERNGTIVIGEAVRLSRVAVKHGNLTISTVESPQVSQPAPLSDGQTVVVPRTDLNVTEDQGNLNILEPSRGLVDLVNSLNALGVTPKEMSAILQELKRSGSLHGELVFD